MKTCKLLLVPLLVGIGMNVFSQPGYYPPPSSVEFHNDTLTIFPPDSLPGAPVIFLGYNIYVDSIFFDNILDINPNDSVDFIFERPELLPGSHSFCVKALYNDWISDYACDTGTVVYGIELPFLEDWSSNGFEENLWGASGNWQIESDNGFPSPCVQFNRYPVQTDYTASLESYPIIAIGQTLGRIWLDFNIKLDAVNASGEELLLVQVWNWNTNSWNTVELYSNEDGSFEWSSAHIYLSSSRNKVFRVRFLAKGENSASIQRWSVDNIHIYRKCDGATNLDINEYMDHNDLYWEGPTGCNPYGWIHWDDGVNAGNSIGTGDAVEFDVAARWTPVQLASYAGFPITLIAFFPAESAANYRARIWIGEGADTMILDEPVVSPLIGQWNYFTLPEPIMLDVTQELWVGYNTVAQAGYPAGVDDGPEIDGYGNMMYWDSTWQTLIEINPDLTYNWNIACRLGPHEDDPLGYFLISRQTNNEGFQVIDSITDWHYHDYTITLTDYYCYKVELQWYTGIGDSCLAEPSNTACEYLMLGTDQKEYPEKIRIYPNPASNHLNIESGEDIREVRIYNPLGEVVLKVEIGNSEGQIDVSRLGDGLYFVEVVTESKKHILKVVILAP